MKKLVDSPKFVIYDDLMSDEQFKKTWSFLQMEDYRPVQDGHWMKVWRLTDGMPMTSKNDYRHSKRPFNNQLDIFFYLLLELAKRHTDLLGVEGVDWNEIVVRMYMHSRGSRLGFHNDVGHVSSAVFYAHPYWGSTWGGELFIAETPPTPMPSELMCLEHSWEDNYLSEYGMGHYITPKPNRIVFSKAGVWHQINRVDPDAGDHPRVSIVAFFRKENNG